MQSVHHPPRDRAREVGASTSPDSKERLVGTLVWIFLAGAAPTVTTGQTVTRLMLCSCANLHASFSRSTLEIGYAQAPILLAVRYSTSDQEDSSSTRPSPCSGLLETAAADEVRTTRFTVPAFTHDLITFRVPWTAGSIGSFSGFFVWRFTGAAMRKA
uniref:Uncharacterized protein n=1 Tax=Arundo donax TaxID=35708 RepID=A0A0A9DAL4_ARUDO